MARSRIALVWALGLVASGATAGDTVPKDTAPEWTTGCEARTADQFGDAKQPHCFLALNNHGVRQMIMEDYSYLMRWAVLVVVDAAGMKLNRPRKSDSRCGKRPERIAVDGERIDRLSAREQVERVKRGKYLVWEEQSEWPYCGIAPHATYLVGVGPAIDKLQQQWIGVSSGTGWDATVR